MPRDLKGNHDLLAMTKPAVVRDIDDAFLEAGSDIIQTNTFNAQRISQADYGCEHLCRRDERDAARLARASVCDKFSTADRPRWVVGVLGPTNRTASLSPDVNDPGYRAITFDELARDLSRASAALIEGGVDRLMIETIFDTLNAKAAIFASSDVFDDVGLKVPIWFSGTITDKSGRTLTGQTTEAFWHSIRHTKPFAVGLNCALGADGSCGSTWPIFRASPTRWCRRIRMRVCRMRSAAMTIRRSIWRAYLGEFAHDGLAQHRRRVLRHVAEAYQGASARR